MAKIDVGRKDPPFTLAGTSGKCSVANGVPRREWRKLKVAGHAEAVLAAVNAL